MYKTNKRQGKKKRLVTWKLCPSRIDDFEHERPPSPEGPHVDVLAARRTETGLGRRWKSKFR